MARAHRTWTGKTPTSASRDRSSPLVATVRDDVAAVEGSLSTIESDITTIEGDLAGKADAAALADLQSRVDAEVPTRADVESLFAAISHRIDDPTEHHTRIVDILAELDAEARESHALRDASFSDRLRWLLTGTTPDR